jgi:RNA polymerase sigma factor (TIGR02999 family)
MAEITELLNRALAGDQKSPDVLFAEMYGQLRQLAHSRLRRVGNVTLLDTTSLVHESYLRLTAAGTLEGRDQSRFFAYAARVMRSVVVDFIRQSRAARRGGDVSQLTLNTDIGDSLSAGENEVMQVSEALDVLGKTDERLVQLVEMKYFAGLTENDIAAALGMSERTLRREWQKARLLLRAALA